MAGRGHSNRWVRPGEPADDNERCRTRRDSHIPGRLDQAAEALQEEAARAGEEARRAATATADEGKRYAADTVQDFAAAARVAGDALNGRDRTVAARFVTEAADGLAHTADSIQGASVDDVVDGVSRFARRNPGAFLIGAVIAGVALGSFARAASDRARSRGDEETSPASGPASGVATE